MNCSKCGAEILDTAAYCPSCGAPIGAAAYGSRGIPLAPSAEPIPAAATPAISAPAAAPSAAYRPAASARPMAYAGFWLRFVAFIIDALIIGIPFSIVVLSILASSGSFQSLLSFPPASPTAIFNALGARMIYRIALGSILLDWLYYALMESSRWQATLGKKALGLYATDLAGNRMSFGRATGRYFGMVLFRIVPLIGPLLLFPIDCVCAGVTGKKQALHDMMAGCLVMRKV